MKLISLTMLNFMPFKGQTEIDFPTDDFRNILVVMGDNMRGKTSILNAVRWGFYQECVGRHSRLIALNDLLNWEARSEKNYEFEVRVKFTSGDDTYDLRRRATVRSTIAEPKRSEDFIVEVHLRKNGTNIQGDRIDAEINRISPKQVSRFFLFDGELLQEYETLLLENSDQGKQIKESIEQVLGVPALINGRDELGTILKIAQREQQNALKKVKGLERLAEQQSSLTAKQDSLETDIASLKTKLRDTQEVQSELEDAVSNARSVHDAQIQLESLKLQAKEIDGLKEDKENGKLSVLSEAWKDMITPLLAGKVTELSDRRDEIFKSRDNRTEIKLKITNLKKLLDSGACPTCLGDLGGEHGKTLQENLIELEGEHGAMSVQSDELETLSAELKSLRKITPSGARKNLIKIEQEIQGLELKLAKHEDKIAELEDIVSGHDTAEIKRNATLLKANIKEEARLTAQIEGQVKKVDSIKTEISQAQHAIDQSTHVKNMKVNIKASKLNQLVEIFDESINVLRDRLREKVEERATEAFLQMTTQKDYTKLSINENYGLSILDEHGNDVNVRSAGAEQVVALSLIDGLNRTGRVAGPILMDTPLGRLDLKHRDNILTYLPTAASQLILLAHDGEIRVESDLESVKPRIASVYEIKEVNARHSKIERVTSL